MCAWHPQGIFLATCGANKIVNIVNRQGEPHAELPLEGSGRCLQLEWDAEGEKLAILQQNSPVIRLWDANMNNESSVDTNQKDLTYIKWAAYAPVLAIVNQKGTLCLFDKRRSARDAAAVRAPLPSASSSVLSATSLLPSLATVA